MQHKAEYENSLLYFNLLALLIATCRYIWPAAKAGSRTGRDVVDSRSGPSHLNHFLSVAISDEQKHIDNLHPGLWPYSLNCNIHSLLQYTGYAEIFLNQKW